MVITSATTVSPKWLDEFGCAGYLPKPFPLDTLVATIERLIHPEEPQHAAMTDVQILLILAGVVVAFAGYVALCDRVRR